MRLSLGKKCVDTIASAAVNELFFLSSADSANR